MKYNLGDIVYWVESSINRGVEIPCPICFGNRHVTLVLGDESKLKTECGYCSKGFDGPTGTIKDWVPYAKIHSGEITGISKKDGIRYEVGYRTFPEYELFESEVSAGPERDRQWADVLERADDWRENSFRDGSKKQSWSAGYHRNCIKRAMRNVEWHQKKVEETKCSN